MKKLISLVVSLLVISLLYPVPIFADTTSPKVVVLEADQVIDRDYFAAGDIVEIYGTVNGDVYAAGGQVTIDGAVTGDVIAAGGQLKIGGNVSQNVRIVGGQVDVRANIGRNTSIAGGSVTISPEARLNRNLVLAAGSVEVAAPIAGDITAGVGNLTITAPVAGNITAGVGTLRLADQANIAGDITYYSETGLTQASTASVSGTITQHLPDQIINTETINQSELANASEIVTDAITNVATVFRLIGLVTLVVIGLLIVNFLPNFTYRTVIFIEEKPWKTAGYGLVAILIIPIISFFLLITIIGIPLSLITTIVYLLLLFVGRVLFVYWLGARFLIGLKRKANKTITFLIGSGIFFVLTSIALVGPITTTIATLFGTGAVLLAIKKTYQSGRKLKIF